MPVKAPVINTTGWLIFRFLMMLRYLPAEHGWQRREADERPRVFPEGGSVMGKVGTTGARNKDFVSWWACLGDMERVC
jgi:hypothetical protein